MNERDKKIKIGDIFKYKNGKTYKCISGSCSICDFFHKFSNGDSTCMNTETPCGERTRKDNHNVCFVEVKDSSLSTGDKNDVNFIDLENAAPVLEIGSKLKVPHARHELTIVGSFNVNDETFYVGTYIDAWNVPIYRNIIGYNMKTYEFYLHS